MTKLDRNPNASTLLLALACAALVLLPIGCASGTQPGDVSTAPGSGVAVSESPAGSEPPPAEGSPTAAPEDDPTAGPTAVVGGDPAAGSFGGTPPSVATEPQAQTAPGTAAPLGEAEVLGVLQTVHTVEVKAAQLATAKATTPQVREFARMMAAEHQLASQQLQASAATPPLPNPLSQVIEQQVNASLDRLDDLTGPDFDRSFIDSQVQMHQQVLQLLDSQLLPAAQSPEVRQLAESMRRAVSEHLKTAEQIAGELRQGR